MSEKKILEEEDLIKVDGGRIESVRTPEESEGAVICPFCSGVLRCTGNSSDAWLFKCPICSSDFIKYKADNSWYRLLR